MAACRVLSGLLRRASAQPWERTFPGARQSLRIEPSVLRHIRRYRQVRPSAREGGGQLYGAVTDERVTVSHVAGPRRTDERGRFWFRSDPKKAQIDIERFARRSLLYLGEWHTHAEAAPRPSGSDEQAMRQIYARSLLNTNALLLVILGCVKSGDDIRVWYLDGSGVLQPLVK